VVEVNGQNVEKESLEDVILLVKGGGDTLSLLVVDQKGYDWLKKNVKPITVNKLATISEVCNKVLLCFLVFGISVGGGVKRDTQQTKSLTLNVNNNKQ